MSDAQVPHEVVIVRRRGGDGEEGHHGGAWKIAFADLMTAMMAFFLVDVAAQCFRQGENFADRDLLQSVEAQLPSVRRSRAFEDEQDTEKVCAGNDWSRRQGRGHQHHR